MKIKEISYFVLASIFSLCLLISVASVLLYSTLCQNWYVEVAISKSNYCEKVASSLNKDIADYALGSNIPKNILENIVTKEQVEKDTISYLKQINLQNEQVTISTDEMRQTVVQKIQNYSTESGQAIYSEEAISNLADQLTTVYIKAIQQPFFSQFFKQVLVYRPVLVKIFLYSAVCGSILYIFLFRSLWEKKRLLYLLFACSLLATSVPFLLPAIYLLATNYFSRVPIHNESIYYLTKTYLNSLLYMSIFVGIELFLVGLLFGIIAEQKELV
ncbi:hypothetical protein I6N96_07680 [Enterococcus sp. BWM-S5]|uniref:Integral membrane protein n=1 Tax=Enterococcus larvae TaxID=2794352 RepID=A0ABS4CIA2_9ENTE|nr:hypothetical protein [Enterococcus larvae]MBP1046160.1 hypothetical protein [Enterococcus larvae]